MDRGERRKLKLKKRKFRINRKADKTKFVKKTIRSKNGVSRDFSKIYLDEIV